MPENQTMTDRYEKRFVVVALGKGYITQNQMLRAITVQELEDDVLGTHRPLAEICLCQDFMDANQIEQVVKEVLFSQADYLNSVELYLI